MTMPLTPLTDAQLDQWVAATLHVVAEVRRQRAKGDSAERVCIGSGQPAIVAEFSTVTSASGLCGICGAEVQFINGGYAVVHVDARTAPPADPALRTYEEGPKIAATPTKEQRDLAYQLWYYEPHEKVAQALADEAAKALEAAARLAETWGNAQPNPQGRRAALAAAIRALPPSPPLQPEGKG